MSNEVPQLFDWDQVRNQPGDRWARAELNHGVVEFVAPTEYMVRPPQPAVFVFLIDVSHNAIQSGMVATATRTILENLDRIPNEDNRTKVAFLAFDTSLHFFSLPVCMRGAPDYLCVLTIRAGRHCGLEYAGGVGYRRCVPAEAYGPPR